MMRDIAAQDFEKEVLESELPVFACFTKAWCGHCFPTCLIAGELVKRYEGRVKFVRIDCDEAPELADKYQIKAVPSIILFQGPRITKRLLGYQEKSALKGLLDKLLAESSKGTGQHEAEQDNTVRQRMAEEENVREEVDGEGVRWIKVYFGGGAHLKNWLDQFFELKGKENVKVTEADSRGFQCYEESGEQMYRVWVKKEDLGGGEKGGM